MRLLVLRWKAWCGRGPALLTRARRARLAVVLCAASRGFRGRFGRDEHHFSLARIMQLLAGFLFNRRRTRLELLDSLHLKRVFPLEAIDLRLQCIHLSTLSLIHDHSVCAKYRVRQDTNNQQCGSDRTYNSPLAHQPRPSRTRPLYPLRRQLLGSGSVTHDRAQSILWTHKYACSRRRS